MLWGRAASRCSHAACRSELVMDQLGAGDPTLIGEECHIIAREPGGPRGLPATSPVNLDSYANLILLCSNHHTYVDDRSELFTVDGLREMKAKHEDWVRQSLSVFDPVRQRDDEVYASYLEEWEGRADLEHWNGWASRLLAHGHPSLPTSRVLVLEDLCEWLFRRTWPGRYVDIEDSFDNFRRVLRDLLNTLQKYGHEVGPPDERTLEIEKRYNNIGWDPAAYKRLSAEFDFAVTLTEDLTLELTRAANLICDLVRSSLVPSYRLKDGRVVVTAGPFMDGLSLKTFRPSYPPGTRPKEAYEGLVAFMKTRTSRDVSSGSGSGPEGS